MDLAESGDSGIARGAWGLSAPTVARSRGAELGGDQVDRRRAARFHASFWVSIAEVAEEAELRKGNISPSGISFQTDKDVGRPSTVRVLRIATADETVSIEVMAQVVRVVSYDDLFQGQVTAGAAFEFLVSTQKQREEIELLVRAVAFRQLRRAGDAVEYNFAGHLQGRRHGDQPVVVSDISAYGMVIETDWMLEVGEVFCVDICAPASKRALRLSGVAVRSRPATGKNAEGRHRVEVRFQRDPSAQMGSLTDAPFADAMNELISEVTVCQQSQDRSKGAHLNGSLATMGLPSLLAFLEMERTSGVLQLAHGSERATLYVRDGQIVDLETELSWSSPQEAIGLLLDWTDGAFEFHFEPVTREDALGLSTSAVLIEFAREKDEEAARSI